MFRPLFWAIFRSQDIYHLRKLYNVSCKIRYIELKFNKISLSFDLQTVIITNSSSSVGATARCGLWPIEQYLSIFTYLSPALSIFSLPALEDLCLLLLSILPWVLLFVSSLPVLEWRSFWASYPPPFSPGDQANLFFAALSILLFFSFTQLSGQQTVHRKSIPHSYLNT